MNSSVVKTDRRYTKDHEWALLENGEVLIGITAFAVGELGDITLVNIDVRPGDEVAEHAAFGTIESVKTLSDLFAPVAGTVIRLNGELETRPELINSDCWKEGWMIALKPRSPSDLDALLDAGDYRTLIQKSDH